MKLFPRSLLAICTSFFGALYLNIAIAGPVEAGGTLTCSGDTSLANINDLRFPGTGLTGGESSYLEVFILQPDVDISGWQLCYTYPGNKDDCILLGDGNLNEYFYGNALGDDASPDKFNTGTYLEYEIPTNKTLSPDAGEVLLVNNINGTDVVIDYIQYCQDATCPTPHWNVPAACGTTLAGHDAGNKDIARLPDATGDFGDNGDDVTRGDTNDDSVPTALFGFTFDEPSWNGSNNEVVGTPNIFGETVISGTAKGNATTSSSTPAIPGSPGTCGYGTFDGDGDYVSVGTLPASGGGDENEIEISSPSLSFTAWIRTTNNTTSQTIFSFGNDLRLSLTATGQLKFYSSQTTPTTFTTSLSAGNAIQNNEWYFVALTLNPTNNTASLYTATQAGAITFAGSFTFTVPLDDGEPDFEIEIEDNGDLTIGGGSGLASFNGFIDEPALFGGPLNTDTLTTLKNNVRPCMLAGPSHYSITHDGSGLSCLAESITITAHDSSTTLPHGLANVPAGTTITLSTSTSRGDWPLITSGTGNLSNNGNGSATYEFPGGESAVVLAFNYTNPVSATDSVNFDLLDGNGISELKGGDEDLPLEYEQTGLIFENTTDGTQTIPTQISGKDSNVDFGAKALWLSAIKVSDTNPAICTGLLNNQTTNIELGAECMSPVTCAGNQLSINSTPVNTTNEATATSYTVVSLTFDENSRAPLVLNYPDAGQLQLHARYNLPLADGNTSGDLLTVPSNLFVVRPFGFAFTDIRNPGPDGSYTTAADDILNPGGTASSGSGFIAAEDIFRASIQAYQYDAADDTNVDGIPDIGRDITDNSNGITPNFAWSTAMSAASTNFTPSGAGGVAGTVTGSALAQASFSSGASTSGNLTYDNVGSITLQALATDYITPGGGISVYGYSMPVGRFYPDHFALITNSITPSCSGAFTYMGEPALAITYDLQAQGINNGPTSNYDTMAGYSTGSIALRAENNNNGTDLGGRLNNAASMVNWVSGSYAVNTSTASFGRDTAPDGPYQSLQLGLDITAEQDNRDISAQDMLGNTAKSFGTTDVRYGRLALSNAFGSELLALNMPVRAEYFNGTSYVLNTADSCTTRTDLPAAAPSWGDISLPTASYSGNLAEGETTPSISGMLSSGTDTIALTSPGAGNDGSVTVNLAAPIWLQFDWDGNGTYSDDPSATATFGIFHGNDATIYRRELY